MQDLLIGGRFKLLKKVGSGSFGEIYRGLDTETSEEIAVKLEKVNTRHPQLLYEGKLLRIIQGAPGIPSVHWTGSEGAYNFMVIELLGPSLEDLFNTCSRRLNLKSALMIADQMLNRIEYLHNKCFLHRDIKPDNFLIGTSKRSSLIYLIDFGLAKKFKDPKNNKHIPFREGKSLTGTARYASVNTHAGLEQGRRDDLESIGYVLMYFLRGSLPWQGVDTRNREEKYRRIFEIKSGTAVEELCRGFPSELETFLVYCKALKFEDQPDYLFDWVLLENEKKNRNSREERKSAVEVKSKAKEKVQEKRKRSCLII